MASSRSNKPNNGPKKKAVRFVKEASTSSKRAPKKAVRSAVSHSNVSQSDSPSTKASRSRVKPKAARAKGNSPFKAERVNIGWNDLVTVNDKKKSLHPETDSFLNTLSTARFAAVLLSILTLFTLYVGHVLTSQDLMKEVQNMRRENQTLTLRLNQLRAEEDQMTAPGTIFDRARALGLEERVPNGGRIIID
jgi:hypothetical protein